MPTSKFKCLFLEDSPNDQLAIEMLLDEFSSIEVTIVNSSKEFIKALREVSFDLYIVDINIGEGITGVDLLASIDNPEAWVIISSSFDSGAYFAEYAAYDLNKFYLQKPVDEYAFKNIITSFIRSSSKTVVKETMQATNPSEGIISVRQGNYLYRISIRDIHYIETSGHETKICTQDNHYATYTPLRSFEDMVKNYRFEKISRNILVNMDHIKRFNIRDNYVEVLGSQLPMSRSVKQQLFEKYGLDPI